MIAFFFQVITLAYVLMESRTAACYDAVLTKIHETFPWFQPRLAITDFEPAEMLAWNRIFGCRSQGCLWHYCRVSFFLVKAAISRRRVVLKSCWFFFQAINLHAKDLGLQPMMNANRRLTSIIRATYAIPLLPPGLLRKGFVALVRESYREGLLRHLDAFFEYLNDTWLNGFRANALSVFLARHRTNNVSESANRMLRLRTKVHHPTISLFLGKFKWLHYLQLHIEHVSYSLALFADAVRSMEANSYLDTVTIEQNREPGRPRRSSAVNNDLYILQRTNDLLRGNISIKRFLFQASNRMMAAFNVDFE